MSYSIFCEAFWDRTASPPHSQVVGKKTFYGGVFLADLYHPRAVSWVVGFPPERPGLLVAQLRPAPSSVGGRPCTTPDAWLYRDLFSDISGWLFVWIADATEPGRIQSPTACMIRRRRLVRDD